MSFRIVKSAPSVPSVGGTISGDISVTGNTVLGDAAADTVKFHGSAGSGVQAALVAAVAVTAATTTTPFGYSTAAQADAIVANLNAIRTCLINHGLMAAV